MNAIDCPFIYFDKIINDLCLPDSKNQIIIVDFHAESSREKEALGHYVDGRAALVAGTHTHVQTADERLLPEGTAYITDLGMTGITNSVIGMDVKICMERMRKQVMYRMEPATLSAAAPAALPVAEKGSETSVQGIIAEFDAESGKAVSVRRI